MGGVSGRNDPITAAEDRCPGAYHRAKDLDPLFEGLPLEEHLRLGLGSAALLKKNPPDQNLVSLSDRPVNYVKKRPKQGFEPSALRSDQHRTRQTRRVDKKQPQSLR